MKPTPFSLKSCQSLHHFCMFFNQLHWLIGMRTLFNHIHAMNKAHLLRLFSYVTVAYNCLFTAVTVAVAYNCLFTAVTVAVANKCLFTAVTVAVAYNCLFTAVTVTVAVVVTKWQLSLLLLLQISHSCYDCL